MIIKLGFIFAVLIGLSNAAQYTFNVVSLYPKFVTLYVQCNGVETQLTTDDTHFPLFTGTVTADNVSQYNYVAKDTTSVVASETFTRTYSADNKKYDVFNRQNKEVSIPELPEPFREMFKMGTKKFKPFAKDQIFNVYAQCDTALYDRIKSTPFKSEFNPDKEPFPCSVNIITPTSTFSNNNATFHVIGYGSRHYRKLSFTMKLGEKFMGRKSIKLRALAGDPTLIRERLATELYNALGVPVLESTYARVIINDDVYGLYSFNDNLSGNWFQAYIHGDGKAEVGIDYKIYVDDLHRGLKYRGEDFLNYRDFHPDEYDEAKYPLKEEDPALYKYAIDFTRQYQDWVNQYSNDPSENSVKKLEEFLNVENTLRMLAADSLTTGLDNFWLTGANAALYYNPEKKYYQFIPYDFDLSLQAKDDLPALNNNEDYLNDCITWTDKNDSDSTITIDHYFTKNLLKQPLILNRYKVILAKAARQSYNPDTVSKFIHALADLIKDDVQWNFEVSSVVNPQYADGKVNQYTMEHFTGNLDQTPVSVNDGTVRDNYEHGLLQFVTIRQSACVAQTQDVDISYVENEYDKKRDDDDKKSGCPSSFKIGFSFIFVLSQFIFFFIF